MQNNKEETTAPADINDFLKRGSLGPILYQARWLARLQSQFRAVLDQETAQHCHIANLKRGELTIHVDSATWATRIRYQTPQLIASLKDFDDFSGLDTITCRIRPSIDAPTPTKRQPKPINSKNASLIKNVKESLEKLVKQD